MKIDRILAFNKDKLTWLDTYGYVNSPDNYTEITYLIPLLQSNGKRYAKYEVSIDKFKDFRSYYENKFNDYFLKDKLNINGNSYSLKEELKGQTILDLKSVRLAGIKLKLVYGHPLEVLIAPGIYNSFITTYRDYYGETSNLVLNKIIIGENNKLEVVRLPEEIKARNLDLTLKSNFTINSNEDLQNSKVFKSLDLISFNGSLRGFRNDSIITIKASNNIYINDICSDNRDSNYFNTETYIVNLLAPVITLYNNYGKFKELNIKCKELFHSKNFYHSDINKLSASYISMSYKDFDLTINEFYPPEDTITISPNKNRGEVTVRIHKVITDKKLITFDCPNNVKVFYKDSEKPIRGKVLYV